MHVLEHNPVTGLASGLQSVDGNDLLTLSHRNVNEGSVFLDLSIGLSDLDNIKGWIDTREQNKEDGSDWVGLVVHLEHIEGWVADISFSETVGDVLV